MTPRRRAFTLVEILIVGVFSLVILGFLYESFIAGSRRGRKVEVDQQAVHAFELLLARLAADLSLALPARRHAPDLVEGLAPGLPGKSLAFVRMGHEGAPEIVRYEYDPASGHVRRNDQELGFARFELVSFRLLDAGGPVGLEVAVSYRADGEAAGTLLGGGRRLLTVTLPLEPPLLEPQLEWARQRDVDHDNI